MTFPVRRPRALAQRDPDGVSVETRRDVDLSDSELWLRYFELGGMRSPDELVAHLESGGSQPAHDQDVLRQALSERFSELGNDGVTRETSSVSGHSTPSLTAGLQLGLLGSFRLKVEADPMPLPMNAQRLVSFLALHPGTLLRQHVAGTLWGNTTDRRAAGNLRSALWRLRETPYPLVEISDSYLQLAKDVDVDVHASEALARRFIKLPQRLEDTERDVAMLSTDLLPDWTEDWVLVRREYHCQLRLRALESLCRKLVDVGRFGEAVQAGMRAVAGEPLRESAQRVLVEAHLGEGNAAAAVKQYETFVELLRDELQLEPSTDLQTLINGLRHETAR